jgi:hypothetical protein
MTEPDAQAPASRSFIATALIVLGLIWMTLTGLCTAVFMIPAIFTSGEGVAVIPSALFIAVICIGPGFLIWQAGRFLSRRRNGAGG